MPYLSFADLEAGLVPVSFLLAIIGFLSISLNKFFFSYLDGKYLETFLFSE